MTPSWTWWVGMRSDLARAALEDEPPRRVFLLHERPLEDVAEEGSRGHSVIRVDKEVYGGDHCLAIVDAIRRSKADAGFARVCQMWPNSRETRCKVRSTLQRHALERT